MLLSVASAQQGPQGKGKAPVDSLAIKLQQSLLKSSLHHSTVPTGSLSKLTTGFPPSLTFEPEVEQDPVHLRTVPDELLIMILRKLDPTTIERFAMVNRKCRLLTLDSSIWRYDNLRNSTSQGFNAAFSSLEALWQQRINLHKCLILRAWFQS